MVRTDLTKVVILLFLVILAGCAGDTTTAPTLNEVVAARYAAYKAANNLPENAGVLVHLQTPNGAFTSQAGLPLAADENWHYRIASVSKTFTAASIMLLDQQGKLRIDDHLSDLIPGTNTPYLPDTPTYAIPYKSQITIRQVLSHRAGIFDVFNDPLPFVPYNGYPYASYVKSVLNDPYHLFSIDELAGVLSANHLLYFEPGTNYHYSDTGYSLLAKIVEQVSGKTYEQFITDNLLAPLQLAQTRAPWRGDDNQITSPSLPGYVRADSNSQFEEISEDNMSDQVGPGNVISTPANMGRWIRMLLSGRGPLTQEQVSRMTTKPTGNPTYALGIGNSPVGLGHTGAHPGYVNLVAYHPQDDVAVVVVTPFIDYSKMQEHVNFLYDIARDARKAAGYTASWPPQ